MSNTRDIAGGEKAMTSLLGKDNVNSIVPWETQLKQEYGD